MSPTLITNYQGEYTSSFCMLLVMAEFAVLWLVSVALLFILFVFQN